MQSIGQLVAKIMVKEMLTAAHEPHAEHSVRAKNIINEMARAAYDEWIAGVECCEPPFDKLPPAHVLRLEQSMVRALTKAAELHPLIRAACVDMAAARSE